MPYVKYTILPPTERLCVSQGAPSNDMMLDYIGFPTLELEQTVSIRISMKYTIDWGRNSWRGNGNGRGDDSKGDDD